MRPKIQDWGYNTNQTSTQIWRTKYNLEKTFYFAPLQGQAQKTKKGHTHSVAAQPPGGLANPASPVQREGGTHPKNENGQ